MFFRSISAISIVLLLGIFSLGQQQITSCNNLEYANRNQVDPHRSVVNATVGRVIAETGDPPRQLGPIPACLGLFTEKDHRLVASAMADEEGQFKFKPVRSGLYRLVVRDPQNAFCVVNMPLRIVETRRGRPLVIHMRRVGIDDCSYGDFK
jgi:hypothetical protein